MTATFRVLYVCTGNICRSALAEVLTRHLLAERLGPAAREFVVASAGVHGVVGGSMHPDTRAVLPELGVAGAGGFVARHLHSEHVERADLVLGATTQHREAVTGWLPRARPRTFSIREFARLATDVDPAELPHDPPERARALTRLAHQGRTGAPPPAAVDDDVPDPISGPAAAHRRAALLIRDAVHAVVDVIAPPEHLPR